MRPILAIALSSALALTASNVYAMQKGHGPKAKTTHASAPKAHTPQGGPKATAATPKAHAAQGPKVKATTPKPKGGSHAVAKGGGHKTTSSGAVATTGAKHTKKTTTTTTTTTGTTLTPVQQKLQRNTNLASKLSGRLPAGTDLMTASQGFRNLGQFVAAVNVSNNLGIPFADLKTAMVVDGLSLGQAIKSERPRVDSTIEVRRAETDATRLIESTTSTTTKTKTSSKTKTSTKTKERG